MKDWSGKLVATLAGCIVSLLVMTVTLGANTVTEEEVSRQIATESPYALDRSLILFRLKQIEKKLNQLLERD